VFTVASSPLANLLAAGKCYRWNLQNGQVVSLALPFRMATPLTKMPKT